MVTAPPPRDPPPPPSTKSWHRKWTRARRDSTAAGAGAADAVSEPAAMEAESAALDVAAGAIESTATSVGSGEGAAPPVSVEEKASALDLAPSAFLPKVAAALAKELEASLSAAAAEIARL